MNLLAIMILTGNVNADLVHVLECGESEVDNGYRLMVYVFHIVLIICSVTVGETQSQ